MTSPSCQSEEPPVTLSSQRPASVHSVLICGVEAVFGLLLERIVRRSGFNVVYRTQSGEEALHCAGRSHPEVVLTEMHLPGMDGIELSDQLRRSSSTSTIVMYDRLDEVSETRAGAGGCIQKPLSEKDL